MNHHRIPLMRALAATFFALALAACGGSDDPPAPPSPPPVEGSATIGADGGFVDGPDGVRLGVPAGAVDSGTTFRISRDDSGAPPLPGGIDLLSAVYAITPHGQVFSQPVAVRVPANVALAAGRPTFLMKAEPGGRWAVIGTDSGSVEALTASIDSLSYVAVGVCTNNLPPNSPFAQNCPSSNVLSFVLLTDSGDPFPVSQDTTYGAIQPVLLVTTPTVLTARMTWTRTPLTVRTDVLDTGSRFTGTGDGVLIERQAGIAWSSAAPDGLDVSQNLTREFTITVTPAQVASARSPDGVVRPLWAQARAGDWEYNAVIPIRIRDVGAPTPTPTPTITITQQPAHLGVTEGQPAGFTVLASITPAAALTYQWARRANASATFTPIAGATAASYNLASTALSDDGAQFEVAVCAAPTRCVTSAPATLAVVQAPVAPSFTTQPANISVASGQTASFSVTATGNPLPRIDWQSATGADPNNFTSLSVAPNCVRTDPPSSGTSTAATCTVGPLVVGDSGRRYRAAATNSVTTTHSTVATVTVNAVPEAPTITQQPQAQAITVGGSVTFSVTATGTATLAYTWQQSGTNLPSVSGGFNAGNCSGTVTYSNGNATITLSGLSAGCNGVPVSVTVSNGVSPNAVSNSVTLTVNPAVTSGACFAGQSSWCYANPSPQAGGLFGLAYTAATSTFTTVGESGTTLRTADRGATWQFAFEAGRTHFTDVASPIQGLLVAAGLPPLGSGQNSGVFTSTDGGQTWTRRLDAGFPGQYAVTKLAFANASAGVAAGPRGLWRTEDGGSSWAPVANVPGAEGVVFSHQGGVVWADANVVLIYGSSGKILRSADRGVTWTNVSPAGFVDIWFDMAFNAAGVGVAVGPNRRVARSVNGGVTWQEVLTPNDQINTAVAFADSNTVVVLGDSQTMRSTDAGATWTAGFWFGASSRFRLRFADPTFGLAVSAISGLTLRTTDAGLTWARIGGGTIDENVTGMAASPSGNVVLAGSLGRDLLRSADGGATWARPGFSLVGLQFQKPSFATEQRVIAIRPSGQVALSDDAGQTWSIAYDRLGQVSLSNTTMATASVGLVVGNNGLILRTSDGGANWNPVVSGTPVNLRAVGCLTATVCLAAGGFIDGGLLRSTDGGATWAALPFPASGVGITVSAIKRFSDSVAFIAAGGGLWRSVDAGLTWTRVYTAVTGGSQLDVSFNDAGIGIAVGYDGILRSTDQGLTWAAQPVPAPSTLNAVTWVTATTVLVGGDGGAILRNLRAGAP